VIPLFSCATNCLGIILLCSFLFYTQHDRGSDGDCVSYKELRDMMKPMIELFTKNQTSTTTISPSTTIYYILSSLPSHDGFDSNKYFAWEIEMDEIFGRHICERRKIRNVASVLTNDSLAWWKHLCDYDELPKTWNDVKILTRKTFVDSSPASKLNFEIHSLEDEPTIAFQIVPNILQEVEIKQEKEEITESNNNTNPI
jgi:hypothetical protein